MTHFLPQLISPHFPQLLLLTLEISVFPLKKTRRGLRTGCSCRKPPTHTRRRGVPAFTQADSGRGRWAQQLQASPQTQTPESTLETHPDHSETSTNSEITVTWVTRVQLSSLALCSCPWLPGRVHGVPHPPPSLRSLPDPPPMPPSPPRTGPCPSPRTPGWEAHKQGTEGTQGENPQSAAITGGSWRGPPSAGRGSPGGGAQGGGGGGRRLPGAPGSLGPPPSHGPKTAVSPNSIYALWVWPHTFTTHDAGLPETCWAEARQTPAAPGLSQGCGGAPGMGTGPQTAARAHPPEQPRLLEQTPPRGGGPGPTRLWVCHTLTDLQGMKSRWQGL